jgi:hypothetical protein
VQVFVGRKPHYLETVLDSTVVDVQQLNTSDWSTTDDEAMQKDPIGQLILFSFYFNLFFPLILRLYPPCCPHRLTPLACNL